MARKNNFLIYTILIVLAVVLIGTPFFFKKNLSVGEYISALWQIPSLLDENLSLHMQVEDLKNNPTSLEESGIDDAKNTIPSKVYSLYPFNTKNRIFINKGLKDGIRVGSPVLASKTILVGIIESVYEAKSEVITPYDTSFTLPVRVGKQETDALLQGGIAPLLTLIDKSKQITSEDVIVTASKDMPYGFLVGRVEEVSEDASGAFFQTTIKIPYNINALRTVYVLKQ